MSLFSTPGRLDGHRWRGMRVGILGGSFNPPHEGHLHISNVAMAALELDCVWWMVTPQNPLKSNSETAPFADRMTWCEDLTRAHPRILVSDLENQWGTFRSVDSIVQLRVHYPKTEFVFLGGTDIAAQMHHWHHWRVIPQMIALGFVARPPASSIIRKTALHSLGGQNHHSVTGSTNAPLAPKTCFWIMGHTLNHQSSTKIRNLNKIK